jgi:hypothetical protein
MPEFTDAGQVWFRGKSLVPRDKFASSDWERSDQSRIRRLRLSKARRDNSVPRGQLASADWERRDQADPAITS